MPLASKSEVVIAHDASLTGSVDPFQRCSCKIISILVVVKYPYRNTYVSFLSSVFLREYAFYLREAIGT